MTQRSYTCPVEATAALFVEGGDEIKLCRQLIGPKPVFYRPLDGRTDQKIYDRIHSAMNDPNWRNIRCIGVLVDMEDDPTDTMRVLATVFKELALPIPPNPGTTHEQSGQRTGYYLLPDNRSKGSIESLLRQAAHPATAGCVDALFTCATNPGLTTPQRDKAWVSAYASVRTCNGRLDQLFGEQPVFDANHPALDPLRDFLRALVG